MPTDVMDRPAGANSAPAGSTDEVPLSRLVGGILDDAQKLIEHQFTLLKLDVRRDLERAKMSGILIGVGVSLLSGAGLLLMLMLVHLLEYSTRPQMEWWVCYAIVGGAATLVGAGIIYAGKQKLDTITGVPEQAAEGLKENLQWKTNLS